MKYRWSSLFRLGPGQWRLLSVIGFAGCAATAFGFCGRFSWFLDLFSHFRVQYLLMLTVLGLIYLTVRRTRTAVLFLMFAVVNLLTILPLYLGGGGRTPVGPDPVRVMLINVNNRFGNADRVRDVVRDENPDILVLEEISSGWMSNLSWLTNSHPYCLTSPRDDNFGIGLFSRLPLLDSEVVIIGGADVPSILAVVDAGLTNLRVIATHPLPPAGRRYSQWRNEQLDLLAGYVSSSMPLVLVGDLNVTPWCYYYRRLLDRTGLIDSSRGRGVQPTWPTINPMLWIPIDHCLHSADIGIVEKRIGRSVSSDHYPVIVDLVILPTWTHNDFAGDNSAESPRVGSR